jgi:hypothetical protein
MSQAYITVRKTIPSVPDEEEFSEEMTGEAENVHHRNLEETFLKPNFSLG